MKRFVLPLAILGIALSSMTSCKEGDMGSDAKWPVLRDSLANIFPTWQAAQGYKQSDNTIYDIVIGDKTFYTASPEEKAKKAALLGQMIQRIYGADGHFEKGELVVTRDVKNTNQHPADGVSTPIPFGNK